MPSAGPGPTGPPETGFPSREILSTSRWMKQTSCQARQLVADCFCRPAGSDEELKVALQVAHKSCRRSIPSYAL